MEKEPPATRKIIAYTHCKICNGKGHPEKDDRPCPVCDGTGRIPIYKESEPR